MSFKAYESVVSRALECASFDSESADAFHVFSPDTPQALFAHCKCNKAQGDRGKFAQYQPYHPPSLQTLQLHQSQPHPVAQQQYINCKIDKSNFALRKNHEQGKANEETLAAGSFAANTHKDVSCSGIEVIHDYRAMSLSSLEETRGR